MMWTYCFLTFIVFLILLIIYLFTHKKTKGTKKPFRFVVWGVGILTIALFAAACILPADNQDESLSKQESTEYYRISTAIIYQYVPSTDFISQIPCQFQCIQE